MKVKDLCLSIRAHNVLANARIEYVSDLVVLTEGQLARFQNCGRKTVEELRERLAELGLWLGMDLDGWDRPDAIEPVAKEPPLTAVTAPRKIGMGDLDDATRVKLYLRVKEVGLSQRARNVLARLEVEFIGDLVGKTEHALRASGSCGRVTISEVKGKLQKLGLRLGLELADWNAEAAHHLRKAQDSDKASPISLLRRSIKPAPASESLEDELRAIFGSVANERDTEIGLKQLGWSGKGQRTLESVAAEYFITRERVRQVVARKMDLIRNEYLEAPRLDEALLAIRECCPATGEKLSNELRMRGISRSNFDPTGVQSAADVLQRNFEFERITVGRSKVFILARHVERTVQLFRLCRKLTSSRGCVNFDAVCDELRIQGRDRDRHRDLVTADTGCEWLDPTRTWLFAKGATRNRLQNFSLKILSVSRQVNLSEMRSALRRSRRLAVVPPVSVLARFLQTFRLASVSENRAFAVGNPGGIVPGSAESILVDVLRAHGPILSWDRFQELSIARGMNPITFGIYASGSPVVARVARGIYSLVGADIAPGAVEDLEREVAAARKPAEWGWSRRGTLWYALRVSGTTLASGSVPVPQFVAETTEGEWSVRFDGNELEGAIKCSNRFLWGLRRPLLNAGAEPHDVAMLEFDITRRTVDISVGGEELVDTWERGDNDLPPPDEGEGELLDTAGAVCSKD
jgi:hypothetical protein